MNLDKRIENSKFVADYIKHLTALSTGSIVLIATLLEKVFANPHWKAAVVTALIGFLASIVGCAVTFGLLVADSECWEDEKVLDHIPGWLAVIGLLAVLLAASGFLVGIISFTMFVIKNILG